MYTLTVKVSIIVTKHYSNVLGDPYHEYDNTESA